MVSWGRREGGGGGGGGGDSRSKNGRKGGFWDNLASTNSICMSMNGFMLPLPTLCRGKYLFRPSEGVTHEFFRQLYPKILTDINVSS